MKKTIAKILASVMVLSTVLTANPMTGVNAAAKPVLSFAKKTMTVGKRQTLKVKAGSKNKIKKTTWKTSSSKKVALSSKKKTSVKLTAKSVGVTIITAKITYSRNGAKKTIKRTAKIVVEKIKNTDDAQEAVPSVSPSNAPATTVPSVSPSTEPSKTPEQSPSASPSDNPDATPTLAPTAEPTATPDPTGDLLYEATFETGTDGFGGRGAAKVASVAGGKSGNCLSVTGRTATWNGASIDLGSILVGGKTYTACFWVKVVEGTEDMKCTLQYGSSNYMAIAERLGENQQAIGTEWVYVQEDFTVPTDSSQYLFYFEAPNSANASFYVDEVKIYGEDAAAGITSIKDSYQTLYKEVGSCVTLSQLQNASTLEYIKKHYSSITMENETKPDAILGGSNYVAVATTTAKANTADYVIPNSYAEANVPKLNFTKVDQAIKIAYDNGLKLRGHTLVWHSQTPEWFFKVNYSSSGDYVTTDVMNQRLEMYVRSVLHHIYTLDGGIYKDTVYAWDVANEYLNNNADANWSAVYGNRAGNLETSPSYLKKAFEVAYDELTTIGIQDDIKLFYNDFNTYYNTSKVVALIKYINEGESAKICKGIGMQSHLDITTGAAGDNGLPVDTYLTALETFIANGFEVQITEMDFTIDNAYGQYNAESQTYEQQAKYVLALMTGINTIQKRQKKANSTAQITSLTLWGLCDAVSWRGGYQQGGNSHPLLFDAGLNDAKPAYYSFLEALNI